MKLLGKLITTLAATLVLSSVSFANAKNSVGLNNANKVKTLNTDKRFKPPIHLINTSAQFKPPLHFKPPIH